MQQVKKVPLSEADKKILQKQITHIFSFIVPVYALVVSGTLFSLYSFRGGGSLDNTSTRIVVTPGDAESIASIFPYVCALVFCTATFFFIKTWRNKIIPLKAGLRSGLKSQTCFTVTSRTVSRKNYLRLPLQKEALISIDPLVFKTIKTGNELVVEQSESGYILRVLKNERIIKSF